MGSFNDTSGIESCVREFGLHQRMLQESLERARRIEGPTDWESDSETVRATHSMNLSRARGNEGGSTRRRLFQLESHGDSTCTVTAGANTEF
jgi:hypothetical protein